MRAHIRVGALLLAAFSPSARALVQRVDSQSVAEREVREASASEVQALLTSDAKTLAGLWSDELVVTNPLNELVNKKRVLALVGTDTLAFAAYERRQHQGRWQEVARHANIIAAERES